MNIKKLSDIICNKVFENKNVNEMEQKMENKKTEKGRKKSGYQITDYIIYLYLFAMFSVYPIILTNKYFNITITRYNTFMICSIAFIVLIITAYVAKAVYGRGKKLDGKVINTEKPKAVEWPEFWIEAFWLANIFACIVSENIKHAFYGDLGRRMGLLTITILVLVVIAMGAGFKANTLIYMVLAAATIWAHILALLQISGVDCMHLREKLSEKTANVFISCFGNINIYASFITLSLPVFVCIFIFSKNIWYRLVAACVTVLSSMAMMMSNSDSAYLGVACAMILIFFLAYKDDKPAAFFGTISLMLVGNLAMVLLNMNGVTEYKKRGGFADLFDNLKLTLILLVAAILLTVATYRVYKYFGEEIKKVNKKKNIIIMLLLMLVGICAIIVVGVALKLSIFNFNDKWGNYRGYIWRISGEIYSDFPLVNKIFGYGNESVRTLTTSGYYEEMIRVTHSVYDNCHNEVLQYLLTTGLVGAVTYVGMFLSSIIYILRNSKKEYLAYIPAAAMLGYFSQGMVAVGQPITTPLFYVFMGIGIGYVRYLKKQEGKADGKLSGKKVC